MPSSRPSSNFVEYPSTILVDQFPYNFSSQFFGNVNLMLFFPTQHSNLPWIHTSWKNHPINVIHLLRYWHCKLISHHGEIRAEITGKSLQISIRLLCYKGFALGNSLQSHHTTLWCSSWQIHSKARVPTGTFSDNGIKLIEARNELIQTKFHLSKSRNSISIFVSYL